VSTSATDPSLGGGSLDIIRELGVGRLDVLPPNVAADRIVTRSPH
jgi:hypothetical protein